ncbi:MAG: hypothetical protein ACOCUW_00715 [Gemmatimonadota bacterium]
MDGPNGSRARFFLESVAAGLVGYATVAILWVGYNLVQGHSAFYTAALLGADLFYGLDSPSELVVAAGPVLAYNGVHLLAFLAAGFFMRWLAGLAERIPEGWYLVVILFLIVMPHVFGLPLWFDAPVRAEVPFAYVVLSTSLAALAMGGFLLAVRPRLRQQMQEYSDD